MKVKDIFEAFIPRDGAIDERDADHEVRIVVHAPGSLGGTPSVGLSGRGIQVGFDWDHGKLLLNPEVPLTRLTPEDVAAIHESVKKGQSWHAYQAHKKTKEKHSEQLQQCKEEIARLKAENIQMLAAMMHIMTEVDGNLREIARDLINYGVSTSPESPANPNDIYTYCDTVERLIAGALPKEQP